MDKNEQNFQHCIVSILEHEGGLSRDKRDPGGITQWGISLRYLKSIGYDINGDGRIDQDDIIGLPVHGAVEIYRKYWWDKYKYYTFNELIVAEKVFDLAVNMGSHAAHVLLQNSINRMAAKAISVDGVIGKQTFAAANSMNGRELRRQLRIAAKDRYLSIIKHNPEMIWAKNGWLNRAAW